MPLERWALFFVTELALCLVPGPAVLFVLAHGLSRGVRASQWASAGILGANTLCFALSATGLGALIAASYTLFVIVKWLGAGYLVYLGLTAILGKPGALSIRSAAPASARKTFLNGLTLQLANPKALLFFVGILPQFIDPREPLLPQVAILGLTSIVAEFAVLLAYGAGAARFHALATQPRFAAAAERTSGALLICAGVLTALTRKT